jgi:hypothetical protein
VPQFHVKVTRCLHLALLDLGYLPPAFRWP